MNNSLWGATNGAQPPTGGEEKAKMGRGKEGGRNLRGARTLSTPMFRTRAPSVAMERKVEQRKEGKEPGNTLKKKKEGAKKRSRRPSPQKENVI